MKTGVQSAGLQGNFTNHTVRKTHTSRLMDAEVPVNLKSLDSYKAGSANHQRKMSLILSHSSQESTQTSTVCIHKNSTLSVNLSKDVSKSGVFSGACIGKIKGCTFTFNIAVKKKKAQSPRSPRKEELSSAIIQILISKAVL